MSTYTFTLIAFLSLILTTTATTIGVTYVSSPDLPPPEHVINLFKSLKITAVRLPIPNPSIIRAFSYTNISLFLAIPNSLIPAIASNRSAADTWLYDHVIPYYPRAHITAISVGTHVLSQGNFTHGDLLIPAIRHVQNSLTDIGIRQIIVSTTFSFINIMATSFPPSSAQFQEPMSRFVIKPLLDLLAETNSSFFVSLYPYKMLKRRPEIPLGFALFQENTYSFREDTLTGVRYRNLFDLMVDSVIAAMAVAGHENIPLIVTETGWPSYDSSNEVEGRQFYAEMYLRGLVNHIKCGKGTPLWKEGLKEVYIHEMFDTNDTIGIVQNWGFCYPNMSMKFRIDFSDGGESQDMEDRFYWYAFVIYVLHFIEDDDDDDG